MYKKLYILVAAVLTGIFHVNAQNAEKLYERAEFLFYEELLEEALYQYEFVRDASPGYKDSEYKAEICSLLTIYREKPIDQLLAFGETFGKEDKFYHYWLGRVYARKYMYEEAMASYQDFLDSRVKKSREIVSETKEFIDLVDERMAFFYNTDQYEIHQLEAPINSEGAEVSPAFFMEKDELLFASNRSEGGSLDEKFSIYHAVKKNNQWTDIREITILGEFERENANIEVVDDDGRLFLFNPIKGGDLFFSESRNGQWIQPVEYDSKVRSTHLKSHFYINSHEDRIIYASQGKKDKGSESNLDLYQTFRDAKTGKWSKPAPFNLIINSNKDEDSPYLSHDERTLYFSSKGHGALGGYDVFKSVLDTVTLQWSKPENLGFPINSPDDEIHFKMNQDGKSGYFSSNRLHSKGDFDIYSFWEIEKIQIEGRIVNLSSTEPLQNASIRFTPSLYSDEHFKSDIAPDGSYKTEIIADEIYLIEIREGLETVFTDEFEIHETGGRETVYIKDFRYADGPLLASTNSTPMQTEEPIRESEPTEKEPTQMVERKVEIPSKSFNQEVKRVEEKPRNTAKTALSSSLQDLPKSYTKGRKAIIHNVYFAFGATGLSGDSGEVLNELLDVLKANPRLKIEIGGHTDNIGSTEGNLWVSQKRAKRVKKWLVERGISPSRMIAKGYGESNPLASNDDEENGRELNRRIEIFVVE